MASVPTSSTGGFSGPEGGQSGAVSTLADLEQARVKRAKTSDDEALRRGLHSKALGDGSAMEVDSQEMIRRPKLDRFAACGPLHKILKVNRTIPRWVLETRFRSKPELEEFFGNHSIKEVSVFKHIKVFDLLVSLCNVPEMMVEICKYLRPTDILNLYMTSRPFHNTINRYFKSTIAYLQQVMAPNAGRICSWKIYCDGLVLDPNGVPEDPAYHDMGWITVPGSQPPVLDEQSPTRRLPGLGWLRMVELRERIVNDILAMMARYGYRTPPGTNVAMLKLWVVMDVGTTRVRKAMMANKTWFTDLDLHKAQILMVKLQMLLDNPKLFTLVTATSFMDVLLGQRSGWFELWMFLRRKRYTDQDEVKAVSTWYKMTPTLEQALAGLPVNNVHVLSMGAGHLEGWGVTANHLMRPDELLLREYNQRTINLHAEMPLMVKYGTAETQADWIDFDKGKYLDAESLPTLEEMWIHEESSMPETIKEANRLGGGAGNALFNRQMFTPMDVRRANWDKLSDHDKELLVYNDSIQDPQTPCQPLPDPLDKEEMWEVILKLADRRNARLAAKAAAGQDEDDVDMDTSSFESDSGSDFDSDSDSDSDSDDHDMDMGGAGAALATNHHEDPVMAERRALLAQADQPIDPETEHFNWDQFMTRRWWRTQRFPYPDDAVRRAAQAAAANLVRRGVYTPYGNSNHDLGYGGSPSDSDSELEDYDFSDDEEGDEDVEDVDEDMDEDMDDSDEDMDDSDDN